MRDNYILTAESVTEGHPDKLCDAIADRVLDACLKHDPAAHVACEAMATAGKSLSPGRLPPGGCRISPPSSAGRCGKPAIPVIMRWRPSPMTRAETSPGL